MKKTFEIKYYQYDEDEDYGGHPYPATTDLSAEFTFNDGCTWDIVLWQFCKFLEMTGYEGVRERIRLIDKYNLMTQNYLFTCIADDDDTNDWSDDDAEEDEEEAADEEEDEASFQDIKREVE